MTTSRIFRFGWLPSWLFRAVLASLTLAAMNAVAAFTILPAVSTNLVGSTIELELVETGSPSDAKFAFVWNKGNTRLEDSDRIQGTRSDMLRILGATLSDSSAYTLVFTNQVGTNLARQTASATVYVVDQPKFDGDPVAETRGLDVTFKVNATGGLLSYQWFWQGEPLAGATNNTLRFTNAYANANAGYYTVRVSNPANPEGIFAAKSLLVAKPAPGGTYKGIFYDEDLLAAQSSGFIQFTVSSSRSTFSGSITLGAARYSFSGTFPLDQYIEVEATKKNAKPLRLKLQMLTVNDAPQVTGEVEGGDWTSKMRAHQLCYSSKLPTSLAGKYTLALQNTNTGPLVPNGDGYASVSISTGGTVSIAGRTADGTSFSQSSGLSRMGDWPLHVVTHKGRGRLLGWLKTAKQTGRSIQGAWTGWVKDPGQDKLYPDGFALLLQPAGSTYIPPTTGPIVNFTNGVAAVFGGDLSSGGNPLWSFMEVKLRPPVSFRPEPSPEQLTLSVQRSTGIMSGSFRNVVTGKRSSLYGAILQQQLAVRGFFLSTNAAGAFLIVPK